MEAIRDRDRNVCYIHVSIVFRGGRILIEK